MWESVCVIGFKLTCKRCDKTAMDSKETAMASEPFKMTSTVSKTL